MNLNDKARMPISELAPQLIHYLENEAATKITSVIVHNISQHLTKIMQKINYDNSSKIKLTRSD